jgi:putative transposase
MASAIAREVNNSVHRVGSLWRDRYHRRDLASPRQVRNALVYVLMNFRKHKAFDVAAATELDSRSSATWFNGWDPRAGPMLARLRAEGLVGDRPCPVAEPSVWLLTTGWRRYGLVHANEHPLLPG